MNKKINKSVVVIVAFLLALLFFYFKTGSEMHGKFIEFAVAASILNLIFIPLFVKVTDKVLPDLWKVHKSVIVALILFVIIEFIAIMALGFALAIVTGLLIIFVLPVLIGHTVFVFNIYYSLKLYEKYTNNMYYYFAALNFLILILMPISFYDVQIR